MRSINKKIPRRCLERRSIDQGYRPTRYFRTHLRPVSGLAGLDVSPSRELESSQWHHRTSTKSLMTCPGRDTPTPAYRCGGSPGVRNTLTRSCRTCSELPTWFPFNSTLTWPEHLKRGGILPEPKQVWSECGGWGPGSFGAIFSTRKR
jgi:hypothetical protein